MPRLVQSSTTRAGHLFFAVTMTIAIAIGAMQAYRIRGGWITNYGADAFGTAWVYATMRSGRTIFLRGRSFGSIDTATIVFILCAASEFGQRWHLVPGRFDPYDLLTYACTLIGCVLLDHALGPFAVPRPVAITG